MAENSQAPDVYEQLKATNAQMQAQMIKSQQIQADNKKRMQMELQKKNMAVAILLALFFGPFGLLYSTKKGGLIMIGVGVVAIIFSVMQGFSIAEEANLSDSTFEVAQLCFILALGRMSYISVISTIWAAIATRRYNKEVEKNFNA